jgi:hypothetical protein
MIGLARLLAAGAGWPALWLVLWGVALVACR